MLAILDQPDGGPLGYYNGSYSSWGGNVVEVDGQYHLLVAQFVEHCELGDWGSNSAVIRATAADPAGPFRLVDVLLKPREHDAIVKLLLIFWWLQRKELPRLRRLGSVQVGVLEWESSCFHSFIFQF